MYISTLALFLPALFASGVLSEQTAVPTSTTPDVTYPNTDAFIFCSAQDCTGTCEVTTNVGPADDGHGAPNGMGYQSIYWYDPGHYSWILYTCVDYYDCDQVTIAPNTCYNLYENGALTDFYEYWYVVNIPA